jgi:hypothetical protein
MILLQQIKIDAIANIDLIFNFNVNLNMVAWQCMQTENSCTKGGG